jgi:hypothetical protein
LDRASAKGVGGLDTGGFRPPKNSQKIFQFCKFKLPAVVAAGVLQESGACQLMPLLGQILGLPLRLWANCKFLHYSSYAHPPSLAVARSGLSVACAGIAGRLPIFRSQLG